MDPWLIDAFQIKLKSLLRFLGRDANRKSTCVHLMIFNSKTFELTQIMTISRWCNLHGFYFFESRAPRSRSLESNCIPRRAWKNTQSRLRSRLFLLFFPQSQQGNTRNFDNLESHTGNITNLCQRYMSVRKSTPQDSWTYSTTFTTQTSNQDFVVFFQEIQTTVTLSKEKTKSESKRTVTDSRKHTGTKAVTFLPFLINWTRTHLRIAELGCLASTPLKWKFNQFRYTESWFNRQMAMR